MKKQFLYIVFLFFSFLGYTQNLQEIFTDGNDLYQNGKYQEALKQYTALDSFGVQDADLYFNMANTYYKLNRIAPSIYYYEKALYLDPQHEDARHNLVYAQRMTVDAFEELPKSIFQKINETIIYPYKVKTWAIVNVVLAFLLALFVLLYYFAKLTFRKRLFFVLSLIFAGLFLISLSFTIKDQYYQENNQPAIVFETKISVKSEPTNHADEVFVLHEGTKVQILESVNNWYKIQLPDGNIGWLKEDSLRRIKD